MARLARTVTIVALGLWLGSLVMTGVAAAIIFPTVRDLDPTLATYPSYEGDHWRLGAGHVAARIFGASGWIQNMCAALAAVGLGAEWLMGKRPVTRLVLLAAAGAVLGFHALVLGPRMDSNLAAFWEAARAGDNAAAEASRRAFDRDHPTATRVMAAQAVTVLLWLAATAWGRSEEATE